MSLQNKKIITLKMKKWIQANKQIREKKENICTPEEMNLFK
jgi:hypothetical protein